MTAQQAAALCQAVAMLPAASSKRDADFYFPRIPDELFDVHFFGGNDGVLAAKLSPTACILPDGRMATEGQAPYGFGPAPEYQPLAVPRGTRFVPALPGSLNAIRATMVVQGVTLVLAMLLVVAGIRTLAEWRGAAGMHVAWAVAKLSMSLLAMAVATWWALSMPIIRGAAPVPIGPTIFMVTASMIYPGIVLCIMHSRAVREHYVTLGQPMWLFSPQRRAAWRLEAAEIFSTSFGRFVLHACAIGGMLVALGHLFAGVYALLGATGSDGTMIVHVGALIIGAAVAALGYGIAAWARKNCVVATPAASAKAGVA